MDPVGTGSTETPQTVLMPPSESKGDDAASSAKSDKAHDPESLVQDFRDFVFGSSCSREMRDFCEQHCADFDWAAVEASSAGEHALEHTALHARFTAFFERRVADWCEERGATADALAGALRRCADRAEAKGDDDAEGALLLASLQAIFDFESFMVLMRETKRGASWDMASMFEQ